MRSPTLALIAILSAVPAFAQQRAFLDKYCVTCHNQKTKIAGLTLDTPDLEHVGDNAAIWEKVVRKLNVGAMPPQGVARPDKAANDGFTSWLETSLDRAAAAKPNPGDPGLHRVNRTEYANAIRDLLALDVDASSLLPTDDASYGFDNIASVLGVSPSLLERYVSAAGKISRLGVGDPAITPIVDTYRVRTDLSQNEHIEGLPFGTRGGVLIHHNFPVDGEYTIKAKLLTSTIDLLFGGNAQDEYLEVDLNGEKVQMLAINPTSKKPGKQPDFVQITIPVKAGPQLIGVSFLQKTYAPTEDLIEPFVRSTYDSSDPKGLPHLFSVSIAGPFKVSGSGDTPSRRRIFICRPAGATDELPCAKKIISNLARKAWRRPISDSDLESLLGFYQKGRNKGTFDDGVEMALRFILASPQFVIRTEPDPPNLAPDTNHRITDLELASRLSFFLWSSIPDDELLTVATQGRLKDPQVLERQVRRMLADPRSEALVNNFAAQWLYLRNLKAVFPDLEAFPDFDDNLRQAFRTETEMFFGSILREDRNVLDLLRANYTFLNGRLALHYGIPNVYGSQFRRVTLPDNSRNGLLGQGSILTVTSTSTRTSPVQRGKWILENILGTPPNPPPANVPPLKENAAGARLLTVRERMEEHRANPACAGCHKVLDPLGFSLENFDGVGAWRTTGEGGAKIDASGVLADGTKVDGVATLRESLLSRPNVFVGTLTEKLLTYALGRGLEYYDMPTVRAIVHGAAGNDYRFSSLILGVTRSAPFQMKRTQIRD